jgi:hypothetical protein
MQAEPFTSDVYPSDHRVVIIRNISENLGASSTVSVVAPAIEATAPGLALNEPSVPRAAPAASGLAAPLQGGNLVTGTTYAVPVPLPIVATLVASAQVSLELFGQFDQSGKLLGHRVRYVRTDDQGDVITDVMLALVERRPT